MNVSLKTSLRMQPYDWLIRNSAIKSTNQIGMHIEV